MSARSSSLEEIRHHRKNAAFGRVVRTPCASSADEPELHILKLPDLLGDDWPAEQDRQRQDSPSRYKGRLVDVLGQLSADPTERAEALGALFAVRESSSENACGCSCHPRLPDIDAFWASAEGSTSPPPTRPSRIDGHSFSFRERHGEWRIALEILFGALLRGCPNCGAKW